MITIMKNNLLQVFDKIDERVWESDIFEYDKLFDRLVFRNQTFWPFYFNEWHQRYFHKSIIFLDNSIIIFMDQISEKEWICWERNDNCKREEMHTSKFLNVESQLWYFPHAGRFFGRPQFDLFEISPVQVRIWDCEGICFPRFSH